MTWSCDPGITAAVAGSYQYALPAFANTLQAFMAAQCALVGDHLWPADALDKVYEDPNYDFIVVGAGSAGSVVANRLSEVPHWKVLLIEAGGNPTLNTEVPQLFFSNFGSLEDWNYRPEPQEEACRSYTTKNCAWPRGKVLGGSSSINGMYYVRANKADYDAWAAAGNTGWSYKEVLPYFKKSENFSEPLEGDLEKFHSNQGYLYVDAKEDAHVFEKLILQASAELGMKIIPDINGADQMGVTKCSTTTKDGVRQSTARAFLSPIRNRKNLHVLKSAHVTKLVFKPNSKIVGGVVLNKNGKEITINALKEVIVSAGAVNTPQLLMLSGIGPKKHLEKLGIETKADLAVGGNLEDHPYVSIYYKLPGPKNLTTLPAITAAFTKYMLEKEGPLASTSPFRVISFKNTTDPEATTPDVQFHHLIMPPEVHNFVDMYQLHGFDEEFQKKFQQINEDNFIFIIATILLQPKSKGKIELRSTNPFEKPLIYANYYKSREDLDTMIRGIKQHALNLGDTPTFKNTGLELQWLDLDSCEKYDKNTDEFLECWVRQTTVSLYHPTSTARMGPDGDEAAVVDHELRVRKVERLRVVDASIMPNVVRGNTNAPTIMIGEKGADMIKQSWLNKHTEL